MDIFYKFGKKIYMLLAVTKACLCRSSHLDLTNFQMQNIPQILTNCKTLRTLFLSKNEISRIPEGIVALDCLRHLRLNSNKLSEFPQVVCQLTNLRCLVLNSNNIRVLPSEMENLKVLNTLCLADTGLEYIPEQIGSCEQLVIFLAYGNCIQRLPESFGLLDQLRWLDLEGNKITELPQSLGALTQLIHLNLRKNRLSSFPDVVNDIRTIRCCLLEDNCIETITPRQIELSAFMKVLDITNNPAASSEELVSIFPNFRHVVYNKLDGDLDHSKNEFYRNWKESVFTAVHFDMSDESEDEYEIELDEIPLLIPDLTRYLKMFSNGIIC